MATLTENNSADINLQEEAKNIDYDEIQKWRKAKKVAVMLSFVGKDYLGMQRNPGFKTIEEDLLKSFKEAGVISEEWYSNPQKGHFQRASRTDKGVSAARMIVSLKMLLDENKEETINRINSKLPPCIRVHSLKKVTKNFNAKSAADARTYLYILPTFAFAPIVPLEDAKEGGHKFDFKVSNAFRMDEDLRKRVNGALAEFVGSRYYHNYTSGKLPLEPSSQRYITHFECSKPFEKEGMEFATIKVKGQSFMLHQIRKMIGMTIAVVRGQAPKETIEKSWEALRIDVPRAPGLGLMLDEIHFDKYNKRFAKDGIHEGLEWEKVNDQVEAFKEDCIIPEMVQGEKEGLSMFEWLQVLPIHSFTQRHFENENPPPLGPLGHLIFKNQQEKEEEIADCDDSESK